MFSRCGQFLLLLTVIVTVAACPLWTQSATTAEPHSVSGSDLDRLVQGKRYPELEQQLQLAHLNPSDLAYFTGIVADRNNHPLDAIVDLEKVLPELRKTSPTHTAVALRTLAGDYFKTGRYGEASDTYSDVLKHFAAVFSAAEMQEMTDNRNMFGLLRGAAPQTVSGEHEFRTPIRSNVLGNVEVPIQLGNATEWWILDTGANESSITVSTAKRIGLALSKESASGQSGATGKEVPLRTAVIPKLAIGGIVVRNVIVVVSEDKAFNVNLGKHGHYQIQGILGYPVLAAMGSLTILGNELQVQPESQLSPRSSRLYLEELTPLLEATVDGHDLLFGLDTGSDAASFTAKYLQEFPRQFGSLKPKKWGVGGIGGIRWMHAYTLPEADLHLGTATATLKNVPVVTEDVGVDPLDGVFGNLGQSLLHQFRSYTIDFSQMRFTAGKNATNLENYAELTAKGITPYWCIHHGVTISLYYADPDGNQMEFQVDCCASSEEAAAMMYNTFDKNPVGVEFDPNDWLARLRAGQDQSGFLSRHIDEPISPIRGAFSKIVGTV